MRGSGVRSALEASLFVHFLVVVVVGLEEDVKGAMVEDVVVSCEKFEFR